MTMKPEGDGDMTVYPPLPRDEAAALRKVGIEPIDHPAVRAAEDALKALDNTLIDDAQAFLDSINDKLDKVLITRDEACAIASGHIINALTGFGGELAMMAGALEAGPEKTNAELISSILLTFVHGAQDEILRVQSRGRIIVKVGRS